MVKAFLIGAGATRAQYPTAPITSDFFAQLQNQHNIVYKEIERTIIPHLNVDSLAKSNIEYIMALAEEFSPSVKNAFLREVYLAIHELLAESTHSTEPHINAALSRNSRRPGTLFQTLLTDPRLNEKDFFMTLNYDLYLDREILYIQSCIDYGLEPSREIESNINLDHHNKKYSVYHLHGALNWQRINDNRMIIHRGAIVPSFVREGSNLYLVPPGKKELYPILKSIWNTAEQRLLNADELIIIGCSLNTADKELISLIKKFIDSKGINKVKIISSITHDTTCDIKYIQSIGHGYHFHPHGFSLNSPTGYPGAIEFIFS